jgi:uncharacterized protein with FMN-binding domain
MRRVILTLLGTVTGLVALLSFKTHGTSAPPSVSATGPNTNAAGPPSVGTKTVTGNAVNTVWGPVQVRVTVARGKLADVTAIAYPWSNPLDQQINSYAIPKLNKEALTAGSARIDMISGATYTSTGYLSSLQSALDKAGL